MALEWVQGAVVGFAVGAMPTLYFIGGQHALDRYMKSRAEMVREVHKAVVDIGGRLGNWLGKGTKDERKTIGAAVGSNSGRAGGSGVVEPGQKGKEGNTGGGREGGGLRGARKRPGRAQENDVGSGARRRKEQAQGGQFAGSSGEPGLNLVA